MGLCTSMYGQRSFAELLMYDSFVGVANSTVTGRTPDYNEAGANWAAFNGRWGTYLQGNLVISNWNPLKGVAAGSSGASSTKPAGNKIQCTLDPTTRPINVLRWKAFWHGSITTGTFTVWGTTNAAGSVGWYLRLAAPLLGTQAMSYVLYRIDSTVSSTLVASGSTLLTYGEINNNACVFFDENYIRGFDIDTGNEFLPAYNHGGQYLTDCDFAVFGYGLPSDRHLYGVETYYASDVGALPLVGYAT